MPQTYQANKNFARRLDAEDELRSYRYRFVLPKSQSGDESIYFCGNSLGLQPKTAESYVQQEMARWGQLAVDGHFSGDNPWMTYHEDLTGPVADIVGAKANEIVLMNSLTVNLHLMLVSFYRPTKERCKILMEAGAFSSDRYAIVSHLEHHGLSAEQALIELRPRAGEEILRTEDIANIIEKEGDAIALVLLGGLSYYTGQVLDMQQIVELGHRKKCRVGFDLAHAAGNVLLNLHDWQVDFAVWCNYKYLNAGPGGIGGCFIHERHLGVPQMTRFAGWWGHNKKTRFQMGPNFDPIPTAEGWQISNQPVFYLAALRASLEIFAEAGMQKIRAKSEKLTGYLDFLLQAVGDTIRVTTPADPAERGCQLSVQVKNSQALYGYLRAQNIVCDRREPDVIRLAPVPLYNRFCEVYDTAEILSRFKGS